MKRKRLLSRRRHFLQPLGLTPGHARSSLARAAGAPSLSLSLPPSLPPASKTTQPLPPGWPAPGSRAGSGGGTTTPSLPGAAAPAQSGGRRRSVLRRGGAG